MALTLPKTVRHRMKGRSLDEDGDDEDHHDHLDQGEDHDHLDEDDEDHHDHSHLDQGCSGATK